MGALPAVLRAVRNLGEPSGTQEWRLLCALYQFGDNPKRTRLEAEVAKLSGTWPIPASSGQINRHQLCSGGHPRASPAL